MRKKNRIGYSVVIGTALGLTFGVGIFYSHTTLAPDIKKTTPLSAIHTYHDASRSLGAIRIKMFYAVPKNKTAFIARDWNRLVSRALEEVKRFHSLQFANTSLLHVSIFPKPVILENDAIFYNTERTDFGNPAALVSVSEEIERRIFRKDGDLYDAAFAENNPAEYTILGIMYEDVGQSGGIIHETSAETRKEIAEIYGLSAAYVHIVNISRADGFFLLSRLCLSGSGCIGPGPSLIYHELAHTFGVPDQYVNVGGAHTPLSEDIIGEGRKGPLERTHIDWITTRKMGLVE